MRLFEPEFHSPSGNRVFHIGVAQDWTEWFTPGWNWRNFVFVNLEIEADHMLGGFDLRFGLLGIRVWFNTYDCGPDSKIEDLQEMREDIIERGDDVELEELGL